MLVHGMRQVRMHFRANPPSPKWLKLTGEADGASFDSSPPHRGFGFQTSFVYSLAFEELVVVVSFVEKWIQYADSTPYLLAFVCLREAVCVCMYEV